jgi:hypothetical protein
MKMTYDCPNTDGETALNIEKLKARWKQAKAAVEDAKYLEKLIFCDYVKTIRSFKSTWDYRIPMIKAAQSETDKKKKSERKNLSYIESAIKEAFFETEDRFEIKIHEIMSGGFEGYYWDLHFKVSTDEFIIQIPSREALSVTNIEYAHEGKFVFLKRTSSCCTSVQFDNWTEEGFAEKIKEYFDEYFSGKKELI